MKRRIAALFSLLVWAGMLLPSRALAGEPPQLQKPDNEYVVLLHGLSRSSLSMKRVEFYLIENGYHVINRTLPSTQHSIEELSDHFLADLIRDSVPDSATRVHFVTHS